MLPMCYLPSAAPPPQQAQPDPSSQAARQLTPRRPSPSTPRLGTPAAAVHRVDDAAYGATVTGRTMGRSSPWTRRANTRATNPTGHYQRRRRSPSPAKASLAAPSSAHAAGATKGGYFGGMDPWGGDRSSWMRMASRGGPGRLGFGRQATKHMGDVTLGDVSSLGAATCRTPAWTARASPRTP